MRLGGPRNNVKKVILWCWEQKRNAPRKKLTEDSLKFTDI